MTNAWRSRFLQRLAELREEAYVVQESTRPGYRTREAVDKYHFDEWRSKCLTVLDQIIPHRAPSRRIVTEFNCEDDSGENFRHLFALFRAAEEDFRKGMFDNLLLQIEAEITSDYMGQAEGLLNEGHTGCFDHVPAAVLAGAVLEKTLRTLCTQQSPAVETVKPDGSNKKLTALIDDLKKAGLYNEARAKQLRAWTGIRNHAAHGEFDQFDRKDVEIMVAGVANFIAQYLTQS